MSTEKDKGKKPKKNSSFARYDTNGDRDDDDDDAERRWLQAHPAHDGNYGGGARRRRSRVLRVELRRRNARRHQLRSLWQPGTGGTKRRNARRRRSNADESGLTQFVYLSQVRDRFDGGSVNIRIRGDIASGRTRCSLRLAWDLRTGCRPLRQVTEDRRPSTSTGSVVMSIFIANEKEWTNCSRN